MLSLPDMHKCKNRNTSITFDFRWNIPSSSQHNAPANETQVKIMNAWETFILSKKRSSYLNLWQPCIEHAHHTAILMFPSLCLPSRFFANFKIVFTRYQLWGKIPPFINNWQNVLRVLLWDLSFIDPIGNDSLHWSSVCIIFLT